jgi:hypothetical protein
MERVPCGGLSHFSKRVLKEYFVCSAAFRVSVKKVENEGDFFRAIKKRSIGQE